MLFALYMQSYVLDIHLLSQGFILFHFLFCIYSLALYMVVQSNSNPVGGSNVTGGILGSLLN